MKVSYDNLDYIESLEQENISLRGANEALKAHINNLLTSIKEIKDVLTNNDSHTPRVDAVYIAKEAINSTSTQSLAEHDKKVIAEFRAKFGEPQAYTDRNGENFSLYKDDWFKYPLYTLPPIDNEEK